jgi:hypothetical protein
VLLSGIGVLRQGHFRRKWKWGFLLRTFVEVGILRPKLRLCRVQEIFSNFRYTSDLLFAAAVIDGA